MILHELHWKCGIIIMSIGDVEKADAVENFADNPTALLVTDAS